MMVIQYDMDLTEKLRILGDAAKFDVSCSSSGVDRKNNGKGIGNSKACGICHSFAADGRCISLLKILLLMSVFLTAAIVSTALIMILYAPVLRLRKCALSQCSFTAATISKVFF